MSSSNSGSCSEKDNQLKMKTSMSFEEQEATLQDVTDLENQLKRKDDELGR